MNSLITVIVTTYKRDEKYLRRAIDSVLNQTYKNIELIIVDDNGMGTPYQENVSDLIESYLDKANVTYLPNQTNQGAQVSRNNGLKKTTGEYVAFLDDDDEWLPSKLEKQLALFDKANNPMLGLVYCDYYVVNETDKASETKKVEVPNYTKDRAFKELLRVNYIASTSFPLMKKECFSSVGYFDIQLVASQDYDMWIRIMKKYDVSSVNEPLAKYYKHQEERITSNYGKKEKAEKDFLEKHFSDISKDKVALSGKYKKIGIYLMKQNKNKEARHYFKKSIMNSPRGIKVYKYYIQTYYQSLKF